MDRDQAAALRAPFPPEQIGKLPRKGVPAGLDYIGHAAITDRLLQVDPEWVWEPVAFADDGSPLIVWRGNDAVLWIRLTVCGVTRFGVGICHAGAFEIEKQLISDALRNAAMRFGSGLDLWAREPLHDTTVPAFDPLVDADAALIGKVKARIEAVSEDVRFAFTAWKQDQAFPWPWPVRACEQMLDELARLEAAAVDEGETAGGAGVGGDVATGGQSSPPPAALEYPPGEEPF